MWFCWCWLHEIIFLVFFLSFLTISWWRSLSYRNQSIDLVCKSMDWCLYGRDLCHERVKSEERAKKNLVISIYFYSKMKPVFPRMKNPNSWIFWTFRILIGKISSMQPSTSFCQKLSFQCKYLAGGNHIPRNLDFSYFMMEVPIIWKPVHWFVE